MSVFRKMVLITGMILLSGIFLASLRFSEKLLDDTIEVHNLRYTGKIENAPPIVAFTTVALGGFRGILADLLWLRTSDLQTEGKYFEMVQLADWIVQLQPHFSGATAYLAWNMAYNISVTCSYPEDRWRWVNRGIELIRDKALVYNPEDPQLYKELGWIFQHKIGNILDDAHFYYKREIALSVMKAIGDNPNWAALNDAPKSQSEFIEKYGEKHKLFSAMHDSGFEELNDLYMKFRDDNKLPQSYLKKLSDDKLAAKLETFFRASWLRDKFKLYPKYIVQINEEYGLLDWRAPESQAVYWAYVGLQKTPGHKDLNCERMITQALFDACKSGRILSVSADNNIQITSVPNFNVADALRKAIIETQKRNEDAHSFTAQLENFYKDVVISMYTYGKYSKAREYYSYYCTEFKKKKIKLDLFVYREFSEDVRDSSVKRITDIISGLIFRSINFMIYGDMDAALAQQRIARYIHARYQRENADTKGRTGLAPFDEIKKQITQSCLKNFRPSIAKILKDKLEEEKLRRKKEQFEEENKETTE